MHDTKSVICGVAISMLLVLALPIQASAQMTEQQMLQAYAMWLDSEAAGAGTSVEGGRIAAAVAYHDYSVAFDSDPFSWDLQSPYAGWTCAEKDQRIADVSRLISALDFLYWTYSAGAVAAGVFGNAPAAGAFAYGAIVMSGSSYSANQLRQQMIGTICNPG